MDPVRHVLLVLGDVDRTGRPWSTEVVGPGPHADHLLLCGCCEAPLVYGWLPSELTALVRCECGCCCAACDAAAMVVPHSSPSTAYVKA